MLDDEWRDIRDRHARGEAIKAIARAKGISRNTVRRALAHAQPPGVRRERAPDGTDRAIADLLAAEPSLTAAEIGRRVGWDRGATTLRDRVRALRRPRGTDTDDPAVPSRLTSFVGRDCEIAAVRDALDDRLVSLVGPGGVGKTRLAYHAAASVSDRFADGIRVVELASLRDPALLARTVLDALGVPGEVHDGPDRTDLLVRHLQGRRTLLVLDNCEHLVEPVAALAGAVLGATRGVTILLTSRQALGVGGEHVVDVAPLAVPEPGTPAAQARSFPAVALFADRAAAVLPGVELDDDDVADVVEICRELDGIPLALELAAVRLRVLSLRQLRERLPDRFRLLTDGDRSGPARHRTLEATISWSFQLCTAVERAVWLRASVFTGTFDLDALTGVCADAELDATDVLNGVSGLLSKSILFRSDDGAGVRFGQLETIRGYGHDRLDPDLHRVLRRRHRDRQLRLVRSLDRDWFGSGQQARCGRMRAERADLRAALEFCLTEPDEHQAGLGLAGSSCFLWAAGLSIAEQRRWLDRALAVAGRRTAVRAHALAACSLLAALQGDQPRAAALAHEAESIAVQVGDPVVETVAAHMAGLSAFFSDDFGRAESLLRDSEKRYRDLLGADDALLAALEVHIGLLHISQGRLADARARLSVTYARCVEHDDLWFRGYAVDGLGFIALLEGRTDDAQRLSAEGLALASEFDDAIGLSLALDLAAWTAAADAEHERAATLLGAASARWTSFGQQLYGSPDWQNRRRDFHQRALAHLGEPAFTAAHRRGGELGREEVVALALDRSSRPGVPASDAVLTAREAEIARLVTDGLTNREIAARLVISPRTVEGHVGRSIAKLGFARRAQLAAWMSRQPS